MKTLKAMNFKQFSHNNITQTVAPLSALYYLQALTVKIRGVSRQTM